MSAWDGGAGVGDLGQSSVAVVVSLYNPPSEIVERCISWAQKIGPVIAVDDGSPNPATRQVLDALAAAGVTVLVNSRNSGIAHTLNVGILRALHTANPQWILTMDQDSELDDGYLEAARASLPAETSHRVGMLCASIIGDIPLPLIRSHARGVEVREPIQSGMLMSTSMLRAVGLFDEPMFIDAVDTAYVARARSGGWAAAPIVGGRLIHRLGETIPATVAGHPLVFLGRPRNLTYHRPFRTYYTARNQCHLAAKYFLKCPGVPLATQLIQASILVSLAILAPDKGKQRRALLLGVGDALRGKYGPLGVEVRHGLGLPAPEVDPAPAAVPVDYARRVIKAQILLSTWNGERYVAELLESLLGQETRTELQILIRDDGSSDRTVDIIRNFAAEDSRVELIEGTNVGVNRSFLELMKQSDAKADIYFFCDQDDVWHANKVQVATDALCDQLESGRPALYCSRSMVTDSSLRPVGPTRDYDGPSFAQALVMNIAPGHTMALNKPLLDLVREHFDAERVVLFDHWTYLVAAGLGNVVFDHGWHTWYRNHEANAIGYAVRESWKTRLKNLAMRNFGALAQQAAVFDGEFGPRLDARRRGRVQGLAHQGGPFARMRYLRRFGIDHGSTLASLSSAVLYLFGRYRPES